MSKSRPLMKPVSQVLFETGFGSGSQSFDVTADCRRILINGTNLEGNCQVSVNGESFSFTIPEEPPSPQDKSQCPTTLLPFNASVYNTLPNIGKAYAAFESKHGPTWLTSVFFPLLRMHGLTNKLGLVLLHRHVTLEPNERVVAYGPVSAPWPVKENDPVKDILASQIFPDSWMYRADAGKYMAFEHCYQPLNEGPPTADVTSPEYVPFLADLTEELVSADLWKNVAIMAYPSGEFNNALEFVRGRAMVNMLPGQHPPTVGGERFTSQWFLAKDGETVLSSYPHCASCSPCHELH